ncbi:MAG: nitrogenase-stabilizing/protective protein NifW [Pseudanabaenaceae cyanobacterium SKYGB_i_bin29]|nr:nitrogenase-stabilizing/protective protein NifW [Pseudanabaenaceae cyanobacterium SKYG29]MDW8422237.1 nitrogenase-stabilizing/protective protein NifW [Pseudanabaenaceae cyanobacterium SKYGB_i_bin29]
MTKTLEEFNRLTDAEQYFEYLELPYDPRVVNVNRLHILRKFSLFKEEIDQQINDPQERLARYRSALQTAYEVFLTSSAPEQKLFKVFQEQAPHVVLLSEIKEE